MRGEFYNRSYALNNILDHAIENGEIEPLIVVTPTFYPPGDDDFSVSNAAELISIFHEEFVNDLMPAVEGHYSIKERNCAKVFGCLCFKIADLLQLFT